MNSSSENYLNLNMVCDLLSISVATGKNWIKLGKLIPSDTKGKTFLFEKEYIENLKKDIKSGKNTALKSRRNKKFVSGNSLYNSYVSEGSSNIGVIQNLLNIIESNDIELNESLIKLLLADCALHLLATKDNKIINSSHQLLKNFLNNNVSLGRYESLIKALLCDINEIDKYIDNYANLFENKYIYEKNEDILGLLYISCKSLGNRKATGSYYTPTKIVKKLIGNLGLLENNKILDPCCGTGNFLLQLPESINPENIYGNDIDNISIIVARINMALKYEDVDVNVIYKNISNLNYLSESLGTGFDYIVGNPPWGYEFTSEEKEYLREKYSSAIGTNIESYDIFVEKSLMLLNNNGRLAFVLPEAILNVRAHTPIRKYVLNNCSIERLDYLGNAFDGVQCPCIILQMIKTNKLLSTVGMLVDNGKKEYKINIKRKVSEACFSFSMDDTEYSIIDKVLKDDNVVFLNNKADFALGIVTGNNKEYISSEKTDTNEVVVKGSDIYKYCIRPTDNYITFKPESFQQVAPIKMYRAKEKLLYRFICNQLVFAYDDKQTLSLNSCNIVIPKVEGLSAKYVLAILNSRVAQFVFKKQYNSIKVLRSHIENIPIPVLDESKQNTVIEIVDKLIMCKESKEAECLYNTLDEIIMSIFKLSDEEKTYIKDAVDGDNKFLI